MATVAAVGLASTAIVAAGGGSAAAAGLPKAQSVGRFVDGSAGGNPIQSLADVKDARATAPGTTSVQNPLDVKLFNALDIPLTNVVSVPTNPTVDAGAVNQVATANVNGKSLGAAGAVADDGGANLGDDNDGEPDAASINLSDASLGSVPIPGLGGAGTLTGAALGGLIGSIHGVYSRVSTARGGEVQTPSSGIAGLTLELGSPALANVLKQLKGAFNATGLGTVLGQVLNLTGCTLTAPDAADIPLADGAVVISATGAKVTINVQQLIKSVLDKDISNLSTSNFDLVSFLVKNLPKILAGGVSGLVTSTTTALANEFKKCTGAAAAPLNGIIDALLAGQGQIVAALNTVVAPLASAGSTGLTALADGLKNLVKIGLNVQSGPGIEPREKTYAYESNLEATPNQSTPVVEDQTLVRAIEINVLDAGGIPALPTTGLPSLPGLNSAKITQLAGKAARPVALAPGDGVLNIALANSAAGPSDVSAATVEPATSNPPTVVPATNIPTGIPAGQASGDHDGGLPVLPLVAILMLMVVSGGTFWQYRMRGLKQH